MRLTGRETGTFAQTGTDLVLGVRDDLWLRPLGEEDASQTYLGWLEEGAVVLGATHLPHNIDSLRADIALTKLILYGYVQGVRSLRKLESTCLEAVGFQIFAASRAPDFRTIAAFRTRHLVSLEGLF
jgi:hypothetical protein